MAPEKGGVSQAIYNIICDNKYAEHEVVCMDEPQTDTKVSGWAGIHRLGRGKTSYAYQPKLTDWLTKNIANYTHVIVHGLWQYHNLATFLVIKGLKDKPRRIIMPHGMLDPYFQQARERRWKAWRNWWVWNLLEKKAVNTADALFFTCDEELQLASLTFKNYMPRKAFNVGLGVLTPPPFEQSMREQFLKRSARLRNEESYFLFLSRIHPKKGVDLLIDAYQSLRKEVENLPKLVIAGPLDSSYAEKLIKKVASDTNIIFTGMLQGEAKWGAIYGCEAFILPSHQENFGIAVVEAMACAKPVAITDKVNIYTVVEKHNVGWVFQNNISDTKKVLLKIFAGHGDRNKEKGERGERLYNESFRFDVAAEKFVEFCEGIK